MRYTSAMDMRIRKKNRALPGATLFETIIALFLLSILMTLVASIVTQYSMTVQHQDKKDRSVANIKMALDSVTSEIEEALEVYLPAQDGALAGEVRFSRYTPELFSSKVADKDRITVRYFLDSDTLYRSVNHLGTFTVYPIAHEVKGFSVRREYSRLFTVSVSLEDGSRVFSIDGKACLKSNI